MLPTIPIHVWWKTDAVTSSDVGQTSAILTLHIDSSKLSFNFKMQSMANCVFKALGNYAPQCLDSTAVEDSEEYMRQCLIFRRF